MRYDQPGKRYALLDLHARAGGPLDPMSPSASIHDQQAFRDTATGPAPTLDRIEVHRALYADWDDLTPRVSRRRVALICGGPHGSGKSQLVDDLITESGFVPHRFRRIDPQLVSDALLTKLTWEGDHGLEPLVPHELADEGALPRELSPLVGHEARRLAGGMLATAAERGENMVVETTLCDRGTATRMVDTLAARGYDIHLATITADPRDCARRARERYADELYNYRTGRDLGGLGPRLVSTASVAACFTSDGTPRSARVADHLARTSVVRTHQTYVLAPGADAPDRVQFDQPMSPEALSPEQFETLRLAGLTQHLGEPVKRVSRRPKQSKTARRDRDERGGNGFER